MAKDSSHKSLQHDLRVLLEERNKQNHFLREQLVARVERTAHLETRLLSTLDALDELQASTTRDLQLAQRENGYIVQKLNVLQTVAREADKEKSDMSNAVLQLVEKVESCNDYSKWHASRIEFSNDITLHPVRPSRTSRASLSGVNLGECTCAQAYAPAIVEELSDALAREKRAHLLTVEEAERRIAGLRSRVAARDAEIAHRAATCRCLPTSSSSDAPPHLELMSEEEQACIAARTGERNRLLSAEIAVLEEKLERERRTSRSASRHRVDQCVQTELASSPRSSAYRLHDRGVVPTAQVSPNDDYDAIPAALNSLDLRICQLRKRLANLSMEKEALRFILHNELDVQDPNMLLSPQERRHLDRREDTKNLKDDELDDLDSSGIRERTIARDQFKDILLLEEECIRLMYSEDRLRASLERLQHRYTLLSEENDRLKQELSKLRSTDIHPNDRRSPLSLRPLDRAAVDLAFPPLQPDTVSPTYVNEEKREEFPGPGPSGRTERTSSSSSASSPSSPVTPTSLIEPSEVPLPMTPTFDDVEHGLETGDDDTTSDEPGGPGSPAALPRLSSPPQPREPDPSLSPVPPVQVARTRDLQAIERELAGAQADAEMRERDIAEVRDLMAELTSRIGDEPQGS